MSFGLIVIIKMSIQIIQVIKNFIKCILAYFLYFSIIFLNNYKNNSYN